MKPQYVIQNRETKLFYNEKSLDLVNCDAATVDEATKFDRITDAREILNYGGEDREDVIRVDYTVTLSTVVSPSEMDDAWQWKDLDVTPNDEGLS